MNLVEFEKKLNGAMSQLAKLIGRKQEIVSRNEALSTQVGLAKGRLEVSGEIEDFLTAFQNRVHAKAVEDIQNLLTYAAVDVLNTEKKVQLELETSRGAPALNFFINNNGDLEDVLDGQGGALTNAVVTGLRFLALIRTKNRRLLSLDESDCWIKPSRIEGYTKFLADVSNLMGVQTLFVSHHNPDLLEKYATVHRLVVDEVGTASIELENLPASDWESDTQPGIRQIWLVNFMGHSDVKVNLFPGLNVLTGDNDKGKSTLFNTCLRVLAYNQGSDAHIKHDSDEAHIILTLEDGIQLSYIRKRKGSPKAIYRMWKAGELIHEGPPVGGEPPDWVKAALNMPLVNNLEVHVGTQKEPIFLLNETPSARAQILALGKESNKLLLLMDEHKRQKQQDSQTISRGESELTLNLNRLSQLSAVMEIETDLAPISTGVESLKKALTAQEQLQLVVKKNEALNRTLAAAQVQKQALQDLPSVPNIRETKALEILVEGIARAQAKATQSKPQPLKAVPELKDTSHIIQMGVKLAALGKLANKQKPDALPAAPSLTAPDELRQLLHTLEKTSQLRTTQDAEHRQIQQELTQVEQQIEDLLEQVGHACPLCGHALVAATEITHAH